MRPRHAPGSIETSSGSRPVLGRAVRRLNSRTELMEEVRVWPSVQGTDPEAVLSEWQLLGSR